MLFPFYNLDGYVRVAGNKCMPICSDCHHGECIAPEKCKCYHGYGGPACDIRKTSLMQMMHF